MIISEFVDWIDIHLIANGRCFEADDEEAYHAAALAVQRSFDLEFIPIWDMVNHDVYERINVQTNSLQSKEGFVVHAKQHLAPRGAVAKDGAKKLLGKKGIILVSHLRVQFIIETMPNEDKT